MMLQDTLRQLIEQAIQKAFGAIQALVQLEKPAQSQFGDYATNVAMMLAKPLKKSPKEIAQKIIDSLDKNNDLLENISLAGPGFINFKIKGAKWVERLREISTQQNRFGVCLDYQNKKALVEFVSANPTGPLHVGHGRNAVVGDTLSRLLTAVGYTVIREYYINDGGIQIQTLGKSVYVRYCELLGQEIVFPENAYQGEYIIDLAREELSHQQEYKNLSEGEAITRMGIKAGEKILEQIKGELKAVGVVFDTYFPESSLYQLGKVEEILTTLKQKGLCYEKEGALWLNSTKFGDDKDRVLIKNDSQYTYLTPDLAYHCEKFSRQYDLYVNIWGADHAGYGPRLKAGLTGLGYDVSKLHLLFIQMVSLIQNGKPLSMSTRRAQYETLENVVKEVGKDVTRYFFMMRSYSAQLEFDLDLAKKETSENPVFYIQYAHARICSIFLKAKEGGYSKDWGVYQDSMTLLLNLPEEIELVHFLLDYPELIRLAATEMAPHRVTSYVLELARMFQSYYDKARNDSRYKVITEDKKVTEAKLFLLGCIRQVIYNSLTILGVSAPERM